MGWIKKLKKDLAGLDFTQNPTLRKEAARFDKKVLQPFWDDALATTLGPFSVALKAYMTDLDKQVQGKYKQLPAWLRMVLDDLDAYDFDLNLVHYAEGINTGHGAAITIGYNIYFPRAVDLRQIPTSETDLLWILHELEHVIQYKRTGGINAFIVKYFAQSISKLNLKTLNIHDSLQIEKDADNKAKSLIQAVREGAKDLPIEWTDLVPVKNFVSVYATPNGGIGGYNLKSAADRAFAFDYDHSGKLDHIALYRPATGTIWILKNSGGAFSPVYAQGDPGIGIGGFDLRSPADRAFAFDYDHSGKLDHIVIYRPPTGTIWILKNSGGNFSPVYAQGDPGIGIGGFNLKSTADRAFAFDYDHSGKLDHLVLYRPGTGTMWILKNTGGTFSPVYAEGSPGTGIGGFDLRDPSDRAFAFDYDQSGKQDHIVLYRPGTGTIWILKNNGGRFEAVYAEGSPGNGIGGYDLRSPADRVFAYDWAGTGRADHLVLYRPGTGTLWVVKNSKGKFFAINKRGDPGDGIAGFDLKSPADRIIPFDYNHSGSANHLFLYRGQQGAAWIAKVV